MLRGISKYSDKKFLLISHYATYAMQDLIYEYLTHKQYSFVKKVNFPLPELPFLKQIEIETNKAGKVAEKYHIISLVKPAILAYVLHFVQLIFLLLVDSHTYDVAIAENSLLVLGCIIGKKIGKIKKIVFYSHGIAGDRFEKSLLNKVYAWLDIFAAKESDSNWLLSKRMVKVRKEQGIPEENIFWVPTALQISQLKRSKTSSKQALLFLGTLNEMNGVMLLPQVFASVKRKFPKYTLDIIGDGPLKERLVKEFIRRKLMDSVRFLGVQKFEEYKDILTNYSIGIAPYTPSHNNLLQSTDPMKLRLYMAAGLPIVTTKNFPFSKEIVENNLGFAVEYSSEAYCSAVISLLKDSSVRRKIRRNNLEYSHQFDQENIFRKPLERLFYE